MTLRQQLIRSLAIEGARGRTLSDVLSDIERVGPVVWNMSFRWERMTHEQRSQALDRLDELQAEAREMIETATGCTWDSIQGAAL